MGRDRSLGRLLLSAKTRVDLPTLSIEATKDARHLGDLAFLGYVCLGLEGNTVLVSSPSCLALVLGDGRSGTRCCASLGGGPRGWLAGSLLVMGIMESCGVVPRCVLACWAAILGDVTRCAILGWAASA